MGLEGQRKTIQQNCALSERGPLGAAVALCRLTYSSPWMQPSSPPFRLFSCPLYISKGKDVILPRFGSAKSRPLLVVHSWAQLWK